MKKKRGLGGAFHCLVLVLGFLFFLFCFFLKLSAALIFSAKFYRQCCLKGWGGGQKSGFAHQISFTKNNIKSFIGVDLDAINSI